MIPSIEKESTEAETFRGKKDFEFGFGYVELNVFGAMGCSCPVGHDIHIHV